MDVSGTAAGDPAARTHGAATGTAETHRRRLPGLDVVRGVAVSLVLLRHTLPTVFGGAGIVGVVLFFALSGYLITSILSAEIDDTGTLDLRRFYRNRALRLLPALLLLLTVTVIVQMLARTDPATTVRSAAIGALYLSDLPVARGGLPALGHLWTLAVEEQFYVLWPVALLIATRRRLRGPMLLAVAGLIAVSDIGELAVHRHHPAQVYGSPTSWAGCLLLGALAALYRSDAEAIVQLPRLRRPIAVTAVTTLAVAGVIPDAKNHVLTYLIGPPLIALAGLVVIFRLSRLEAARGVIGIFTALGAISYGLYLWSYAILVWIETAFPHVRDPLPGLASLPLSVGAAVVSWRLIEQPLLRRRSRR